MVKKGRGIWLVVAGVAAAVLLLIVLLCRTEKKPERYYQFSAENAVSVTVRNCESGKGYTFSRAGGAGRELEAIMQYAAQGSFRRTAEAKGCVCLYELTFYNMLGEELDSFFVISDTELLRQNYVYESGNNGNQELISYLDTLFGVDRAG